MTPEMKQALSTLASVVDEYNRNRTSGMNLARDYAPWPEQTNAALELVRHELER